MPTKNPPDAAQNEAGPGPPGKNSTPNVSSTATGGPASAASARRERPAASAFRLASKAHWRNGRKTRIADRRLAAALTVTGPTASAPIMTGLSSDRSSSGSPPAAGSSPDRLVLTGPAECGPAESGTKGTGPRGGGTV